MAEPKVTIVQHRASGDALSSGSEPALPTFAGGQQQGGGLTGWMSQHKILTAVVLGGGGILLLIWFYNRGQQASGADTSGTSDTSGTDTGVSDGSTAGLGTSGYGAPDWSPVIGALTGLQQTEQQDTQSILAQLQSSGQAQATSQAGSQGTPSTDASWQPQPLGSTPGLTASQEAAKQRKEYIDFHVNKNCAKLKGTAKQNCVNHWTQKAGARHPNVGGAFTPGSSLSLRSLHMQEPQWRSTDHQGIHLGREGGKYI